MTAKNSSEVEVPYNCIVRLMLQFCQENNLPLTFQTLAEEARVRLGNAGEGGRDRLLRAINSGDWTYVVKTISCMDLPRDVVTSVYVQVFLEFLECEQKATCANLLKYCEPIAALRKSSDASQQQQYARLDNLLNRPYIPTARDIYENQTRDERRHKIAQSVVEYAITAPSGRLVHLLGQALRWQQHTGELPPGEKIDIFRAETILDGEGMGPEDPPLYTHKTLKFQKGAFANAVAFSPAGDHFATGAQDGIIEIWNHNTGKRNKELRYQAEKRFLVMPEGVVTSLAFSGADSAQLLAAGDSTGHLRVWRVSDGELIWDLEKVHAAAILSLAFNRGGSQLLTGSLDFVARVHGLKSGKVIKEFSGHGGGVNDVSWSSDGAKAITASSDGKIRVFSARGNGELLTSFSPPTPAGVNADTTQLSVRKIVLLEPDRAAGGMGAEDTLLVCTARNPMVFELNLFGQVLKTFDTGQQELDMVSIAVSPRRQWLMAVGESNATLYFFGLQSKKLEHTISTHSKKEEEEKTGVPEALACAVHPTRCVLAVASQDGHVNLMRP